MALKIDAKFEEKLICCFKTDKNLVNFYFFICTLIGFFHEKYVIFDLKKVQRSYLSWHQRVIQNLKKN